MPPLLVLINGAADTGVSNSKYETESLIE